MPALGKILLLAVALVSVAAERRSYNGYSVLRANVDNINHFNLLASLRDEGNYDFWSGPIHGQYADILASPEQYPELTNILSSNAIPYSFMINNVEAVISQTEVLSKPQAAMNWSEYFSTADIYAWLEDLQRNNSNVQVLNIGNSTENRLIKLVKISSGANATKPALWIDGTIHAREWIATTTATYVINQLVNNASANQQILDNLDIYILPIVNPDGYEYSRSTDRLWRKTRRALANSTCIGVDANRNFDYKWSADGNTNNKCSLTHQGEAPFTEPEAQAVRDYILGATNVNWQGFITLHSYSQLWMTPWGYTKDLPINYEEMMRVANKSVAALTAVHGTRYQAGSAANILYESEGTSRDWAKGVPNITYVYTIELRDTGRNGFVLPPTEILPTGQETWAGIRVLAAEIAGVQQD